MSQKPLIAISGKPGAGKSTLADELRERYDVPIDSFARPIREGLRAMGVEVDGPNKDRRLMQIIGTDVFREQVAQDWWIRQLEKRRPDYRETGLIIDDLRFTNEAEWCERNGFLLVYIDGSFRPVEGEEATHRAENDLLDWTFWHVVIPAYVTDIKNRVWLVEKELTTWQEIMP